MKTAKPKAKRSKLVGTWVTPDEYARIEQSAFEANLGISAWARRQLLTAAPVEMPQPLVSSPEPVAAFPPDLVSATHVDRPAYRCPIHRKLNCDSPKCQGWRG